MGDVVIVGSCKGTLSALQINDGSIRWQYDITQDGDQFNFHGDPLIVDNMFLIGTDGPGGGHLYAFDWRSGEVMWKYADRSGIATDIVERDGWAYVTTLDDELICLDLYSGDLIWSYPNEFVPDEHVFNHSPALTEDAVFVGGLDGTVRAVDRLSGELLWAQPVDGAVTTSMVALGGAVLAGSEGGYVLRFDATSGEPIATLETVKVPSQHILVADSLIVVFLDWAQPGSEIAAIDTGFGEIVWRRAAPESDSWTSARPYRLGDDVVVGSERGRVQAYRIADGEPAWMFTVDGTVRGMGFADGLAFIGTLGGMLYCID